MADITVKNKNRNEKKNTLCVIEMSANTLRSTITNATSDK